MNLNLSIVAAVYTTVRYMLCVTVLDVIMNNELFQPVIADRPTCFVFKVQF